MCLRRAHSGRLTCAHSRPKGDAGGHTYNCSKADVGKSLVVRATRGVVGRLPRWWQLQSPGRAECQNLHWLVVGDSIGASRYLGMLS